jgi:hypothetical protein
VQGADGPVGANKLSDQAALGPLTPDNPHQPSLAYIPYLVTGDRYYADEMKFWADYVLIGTWPGMNNASRKGRKGLLVQNQVRGLAWGLRNVADAAAYLPDADPGKGYLKEKLENNLAWLDDYARGHRAPLGALWEQDYSGNGKLQVSPWQANYLAWALDHAHAQGFRGGLVHRDRLVRFELSLFTSADFPRACAGAGYLAVGEKTPAGPRYYGSLAEVFKKNFPPGARPPQWAGFYGVDARLALMIAVKNGWLGARAAYDYLSPQLGAAVLDQGLPDLDLRPGWAIAPDAPESGPPRP